MFEDNGAGIKVQYEDHTQNPGGQCLKMGRKILCPSLLYSRPMKSRLSALASQSNVHPLFREIFFIIDTCYKPNPLKCMMHDEKK